MHLDIGTTTLHLTVGEAQAIIDRLVSLLRAEGLYAGDPGEEWLTVTELAKRFKSSRDTIYKLVDRHPDFPVFYLTDKKPLVPWYGAQRWMLQHGRSTQIKEAVFYDPHR